MPLVRQNTNNCIIAPPSYKIGGEYQLGFNDYFYRFFRKTNSSSKLHSIVRKTKEIGQNVHDLSYLFSPIGWRAGTTTLCHTVYSRLYPPVRDEEFGFKSELR
jgi:hypothetical protein